MTSENKQQQDTAEQRANYEQRFNQSVTQMVGQGAYNAELINTFYRIFLGKSDIIRELFANTNMSAQKTMLHDSLDTLIEFSRTKSITPEMQRLANAHGPGGKKIPLYLFDIWLDSLMEALGQQDDSFNEADELAWRLTLAPGVTFLKFYCTPR